MLIGYAGILVELQGMLWLGISRTKKPTRLAVSFCHRALGISVFLQHIIHIRRRHVYFSILIGQNSVAEWLIVASINHTRYGGGFAAPFGKK